MLELSIYYYNAVVYSYKNCRYRATSIFLAPYLLRYLSIWNLEVHRFEEVILDHYRTLACPDISDDGSMVNP